jgi:hypothetical protein
MTASVPHDPIAALNLALSEIIDEIQELKQDRWRIGQSHPRSTLRLTTSSRT